MAADVMSKLQGAFENLNDRERKLVMALGLVLVMIVVVLPLYLVTSSISGIEEENEQIATVLREINRARGTLAQREAEREAAAARYREAAPPLGSFLEARAAEQELTIREVNDQPDKTLGGFQRRNVRATLPGVGLRPVIKMFTAIENSPHPVALERIQIEHFRSGDNYNVTVGVVTYEQADEVEEEEAPRMRGMRAGMREGMRAGPPRP